MRASGACVVGFRRRRLAAAETNGDSAIASDVKKAVVITGASRGIGETCAIRLDRHGFRVFAGVRKEEDGKRLRKQASEWLSPLMIDVTDETSIKAAVDTVASSVGEAGLAGLVNNAGIGVGGPLEFLPIEELRRQLEVNTIGQIAVTQAFLPLIRQGHGRIVNMGSIAGRMAWPFIGPYNASKFAMEALTDSLRQELRPWGIHVSIVEPGSIAKPLQENAWAAVAEQGADLPEKANLLYGEMLGVMLKAIRKFEKAGIPRDEVAKVVEHALTAEKPKTRYIVGRDAQIQRVLARVVPDRIRDRLVRRWLGLPSRPSE